MKSWVMLSVLVLIYIANSIIGLCASNVLNPQTQLLQPLTNSAVFLTRSLDVQSVDHFCKPTSGSVAFVCGTPSPAAWCPTSAPGYPAGTWVDLAANASPNATSPAAWITVNNCGQFNITLRDGVTAPGTAMVSGSFYHLVSDGKVFRIE